MTTANRLLQKNGTYVFYSSVHFTRPRSYNIRRDVPDNILARPPMIISMSEKKKKVLFTLRTFTVKPLSSAPTGPPPRSIRL
jgi:hypothetical protein